MRRRITREDQLALATLLQEEFQSSLDYREVVYDNFKASEYYYTMDTVGVWLPGNGYQSIVDALSLATLTFPKNLIVFVSERVEFDNILKTIRLAISRHAPYEVNVLPVKGSRNYRLGCLEGIEFDHFIAYGSDETCREVLRRIPPETSRTVHGSKTSVGIASGRPKETELYGLLLDVLSGGGEGCLNSSILYLEKPTTYRYEIETMYQAVKEKLGYSMPATLPEDFRADYIANGDLDEYVETLEGGQIIIRKPLSGGNKFPSTGIGRGSLVIVDSEDPIEDFVSEWDGYEKYLSNASMVDPDPRVFEAGVTRICHPGQAQSPRSDWCHDGGVVMPQTFIRAGVEE